MNRSPYSDFPRGYRVDLGDDDLEPVVFEVPTRPSSLKGRAIPARKARGTQEPDDAEADR